MGVRLKYNSGNRPSKEQFLSEYNMIAEPPRYYYPESYWVNNKTADDIGIYARKGNKAFPIFKPFEIGGMQTVGDFQRRHHDDLEEDRALSLIAHKSYDDNPNGKTYRVKVVCIDASSHAGGDRSDGKRIGREWYVGHVSGYVDDQGERVVTDLIEQPTRDKNANVGVSNGDFSIDYHYPTMLCHPEKGVVFAIRGLEKDGSRPDTPDYHPSFFEYIQLFKDLAGIVINPTKCGSFLYNAASMMADAFFADNHDDPLNPAVTILSHGACRYIYEKYNGKVEFYRDCQGEETQNIEILIRTGEAPTDYEYEKAQISDYTASRSMRARFSVEVELVE